MSSPPPPPPHTPPCTRSRAATRPSSSDSGPLTLDIEQTTPRRSTKPPSRGRGTALPPSTASSPHPPDRSSGSPSTPSSIPRPPNAWILYRSYKIEQLRKEELRTAAIATSRGDPSANTPTTPVSDRQRKTTEGGKLRKGALTASALAALAGSPVEFNGTPCKSSFDDGMGRRSRPVSPTPSLSSTMAPSSSFFQPSSTPCTSILASSSIPGNSSSKVIPISTLLAQMWKSEPDEVKSTFKDMAKVKEAEHKQAYPGYKYSPRVTEKSMKARERCKGVKKDRNGRDTGVDSIPSPDSQVTFPSSPAKRQRYPQPQASNRLNVRALRGQGCQQSDNQLSPRSLSPAREARRPYPTVATTKLRSTPFSSKQDDDTTIVHAGSYRRLRRSPRLMMAPSSSEADEAGSSSAAPTTSIEESDGPPSAPPFDTVDVDELMESIAKFVDVRHLQPVSLSSPASSRENLLALTSSTTRTSTFLSSESPWSVSPTEHLLEQHNREKEDEEMRSIFNGHSGSSDIHENGGSFSFCEDINARDSSLVQYDEMSPSVTAMGFFAPSDELNPSGRTDGNDDSFLLGLSRNHIQATTQELPCHWNDSLGELNLSFEYTSGPTSTAATHLNNTGRTEYTTTCHTRSDSKNSVVDKTPSAFNFRLQDGIVKALSPPPSPSTTPFHQTPLHTDVFGQVLTVRNNPDHDGNETRGGRRDVSISSAPSAETPRSLPLDLLDFSFDHRDIEWEEAFINDGYLQRDSEKAVITGATDDPENGDTSIIIHPQSPDPLSSELIPHSPAKKDAEDAQHATTLHLSDLPSSTLSPTQEHSRFTQLFFQQPEQAHQSLARHPETASHQPISPSARSRPTEVAMIDSISPSMTIIHPRRTSSEAPSSQRQVGSSNRGASITKAHPSPQPPGNLIKNTLPLARLRVDQRTDEWGERGTRHRHEEEREYERGISTSVAVGKDHESSGQEEGDEVMTSNDSQPNVPAHPPLWSTPPPPTALSQRKQRQGASSPTDDRVHLNGWYTEDELLALVARRRALKRKGAAMRKNI